MSFQRLSLAFTAWRQMGFRPLALFALYQLGLRTGHYRRVTPPGPLTAISPGDLPETNLFPFPSRAELTAVLSDRAPYVLAEADEIVNGNVRLFGAPPVPLVLTVPGPLLHWTEIESRGLGEEDIKFLWEPARFGWAYILARAYQISGDERYPQAFWRRTEEFLDANPRNTGPHWISAQEVALRLIALVFAAQIFRNSAQTTPARGSRLAQAVTEHAERIPPTLVYARSQNNNHLLTEAAGLVTAGVFLPGHPEAARWRNLGMRWFHRGLESQIASDGAYTQNSTNYHRLMLEIALWVFQISQAQHLEFPQPSLQKLSGAVHWLLALVDPQTGQVPNLGPNDGASIFPLAACPFADYRPVLQAACQVFLGKRFFPPGPWDEMALWLGSQGAGVIGSKGEGARNSGEEVRDESLLPGPPDPLPLASPTPLVETPHILRSPSGRSWAYLRAARHSARPGHADQLHLDLWWQGWNVAQDAGTYLYNGSPPWENALSSTFVHNTVTMDGKEQMRRAGRFLWLDWAQATAISGQQAEDGSWKILLAEQDGYHRLNISHQRQVSAQAPDRWIVEDRLSVWKPGGTISQHTARLHWLLPDWSWEVGESRAPSVEIRLKSPGGWIFLQISVFPSTNGPALDSPCASPDIQVVRAGKLVHGSGAVSPTWGWVSPTYGQKIPALSLSATPRSSLPFRMVSEWVFPEAA